MSLRTMTTTEHIQPFRAALASDWQSALERDEWFFSRLEDQIVARLSPSEAFAAIDEVVEILIQQHEPTLTYYCGTFLLRLARHSDTTELPSGLRGAWDTVERLLRDCPDIAGQLRSWYRQS
jgi:hypothetical protein